MNAQINGGIGELVFAALFLAVFVAAWIAISFVISGFGGWGELASFYRANVPLEGRQWWFQSAHLGLHAGAARYASVLIVTAAPEGLGLSVFLPFRIGHAALLISWKDIQVERRTGWFGYQFVVLHLAKAPHVPIVINGRLADQLRNAVGSDWPEADSA